MNHKNWLLLLVVFLVIAVGASAQSPAGSIEGTARRADSGDPIKGVAISLSGGPTDPKALQDLLRILASNGVIFSPPANGQADERFMQTIADVAAARNISMNFPPLQAALSKFAAANNSRFKSVSDDTGHFVVNDLPPGQYKVQAQMEGFYPPAPAAPIQTVMVVAGRSSLSDVSLIAGSTISGRVTDESGQPLTNASVQAFSVRYQAGFPVLQPEIAKTTDDRGEYRLFGLQEGEYLIAASTRSVVQGIILSPAPPSPASPGSAPVSILRVPSANRIYYPGSGDVAMAIPVLVQRGAQLAGYDIRLRNVPTYRIFGEIRSHISVPSSNTRPVNGNIVISTRDASVPEDIQLAGQQLGTIPLSVSGSDHVSQFEIDGVAPGAYDLKSFMDSFSPDGVQRFSFTSKPVDVVNQDVSGVVLEIYPRVPVGGMVTVDGHTPGPDTVRIALQVEGSNAKRPSYQGFATNGALAGSQDGTFSIPTVTTGRFHVLAGAGLPSNLYIENVLYGGQSVFDSGFDIDRDEIKGLQVIVRSGASILEGTVRDSDGKPVSGATVVLVPPVMRRHNSALYRTVKADVTGRFRIPGIAPGEYDLFSWQTVADGAYLNSRFMSRYEDRGRRVKLVPSSTNNQDLVVLPEPGR